MVDNVVVEPTGPGSGGRTSRDHAAATAGPEWSQEVPFVRVRLGVAYDGTDFSGWAPQPDRRTVAGELQAALERLAGTASGLTVAGRTDAGVHATGQVCHVDLPYDGWQRLADPSRSRGCGGSPSVVRRLAGVLPPDLRVTSATEVGQDFDARFSALRRRYAYRVGDEPWGVPPLRRRDTLAWSWPLRVDLLNDASRRLLGEHDFAAYCRRKEHGTTIRTLHRFDWSRDAAGPVVATVEADAFCQAMVRSLVGAVLPVGDGRRPVDWPESLLERRERASEVVVVPAYGLTLVGVDYPDPEEYAQRASHTRNRRGLQ